MGEMTIRAVQCGEKPKYEPIAKKLLERAKEFYRDPENERAYQEWKAGKDRQDERTA